MKKMLLVIAAVLSLSAISMNVALAAPSPAVDTKIGVINLQSLLGQLPQMKSINEKMKTQFASRQADIKKAQDEFKKSADDYKKNVAVMSEKDKNAAQDKLIKKEQEVQKMQMDFQRDFVEEQNKQVNTLLEKIKTVVADVAKKENLGLVLIDASVAYVDKKMDVTDAVLNALKEKS
ncbi:MAG: molecular chaperone Skp [Gammaproteobacteria bacterium]|jgi:outer membrane protein|nr:molecular chaperone Skp [Gammaproteobacteria bacterium]